VALPVFTHPACVAHDTGPDHPETAARLSTVLALFRSDPAFDVREAAPARLEPILRVHPQSYLDAVQAFSLAGGGALTGDTTLSVESWDAALGAAGAVLAATDLVMEKGGHAFAAVRPPGHHALRDTAMGFCLVNNVVVAAYAALAAGRARVLIIDWDVHHGNGTQALVEHDARIRFVSLHQHPWYPGTGLATERGVGNVFNVPRGPGRPPDWYVEDLWEAIAAATKNWTPDIVFVSAGFDAMLGDPLGGFTFEPDHYAQLTRRLRESLRDQPIVGLMEGGYIPARLAEGAAAHCRALG
jgi:acetoin utilization deacetylase AcuC-like enzyme